MLVRSLFEDSNNSYSCSPALLWFWIYNLDRKLILDQQYKGVAGECQCCCGHPGAYIHRLSYIIVRKITHPVFM